MRAIKLEVEVDGKPSSYDFLRVDGSDEEGATYRLVISDFNQGFRTIREYKGTLSENVESLAHYIREENMKVTRLSGDLELLRLFQINRIGM